MSSIVVEHREEWAAVFLTEAGRLRQTSAFTAIHHIGSTAIPGIVAKPIVDVLGVTSTLAAIDQRATAIVRLGYEALGEHGIERRRYFRTAKQAGPPVFHLHVYEEGSPDVTRHLAFRDYLLSHPNVALEYSALKMKLSGLSRSEYQSSKDVTASKLEIEALAWATAHRRVSHAS